MCWIDHRSRDPQASQERPATRRPEARAAAPPMQPMPVGGDTDLRASDADRQRVVDALRTHTVDGRLTLEEFEARVEEALGAKTHADLQATLRELPPPAAAAARVAPVAPPEARRRASSRHRAPSVPVPLLVAALVIAGSLVMHHFAWWLIPIGFCVFGSWNGSARAGTPEPDATAGRERVPTAI